MYEYSDHIVRVCLSQYRVSFIELNYFVAFLEMCYEIITFSTATKLNCCILRNQFGVDVLVVVVAAFVADSNLNVKLMLVTMMIVMVKMLHY